ncbi:MAG: dihydrofolate reductase family protein [Jiangellaceae bacterium]|nr:dihydrofolate reductase family protein [Jiangellaceae bacterium]
MAAFWPTADKDPSSMAPMVEFAGVWRDKPTMVFSRTLQRAGWNTKMRAVDEITALEAQPGKYLALGGADLAAESMHDAVIDGYRIYVHPVPIGGGKPFRPSASKVDLRLVPTWSFNGVVLRHHQRGG